MFLRIIFLAMLGISVCAGRAIEDDVSSIEPLRNENIEDDGEIIEFMNNIVEKVNTPKDAITETIKVSAKIKEYVEQAQKEINNIYGKIAAITEGEATLKKSFVHDFNKVKAELRESRQELRALAQETKTLTQDVIDLLDHEEELNINEVELSITSLKELLDRTKELLENAKSKYNTAISVMESVQSELKLKVVELEELSNQNSDKYKKYEKEVRGGVYGSCGAVTVGMIIADVFGCLGICSASATSACWATGIISVEATLETYRNAIKDMEDRTKAVQASIGTLDDTVKNAISGLNYELDILIKWKAISGTIDSKLGKKNFEPKILSATKRIRKTLIRNVKELNNVAKEFLALPTSLFGDQ